MQRLVVLDEGHAKEIGDLSGTTKTVFFVKAHGAPKRLGGVQGDAGTVPAVKAGFGMLQQLGSDSSALAGWEYGHASKVAFLGADDLTGDGANNLD